MSKTITVATADGKRAVEVMEAFEKWGCKFAVTPAMSDDGPGFVLTEVETGFCMTNPRATVALAKRHGLARIAVEAKRLKVTPEKAMVMAKKLAKIRFKEAML